MEGLILIERLIVGERLISIVRLMAPERLPARWLRRRIARSGRTRLSDASLFPSTHRAVSLRNGCHVERIVKARELKERYVVTRRAVLGKVSHNLANHADKFESVARTR